MCGSRARLLLSGLALALVGCALRTVSTAPPPTLTLPVAPPTATATPALASTATSAPEPTATVASLPTATAAPTVTETPETAIWRPDTLHDNRGVWQRATMRAADDWALRAGGADQPCFRYRWQGRDPLGKMRALGWIRAQSAPSFCRTHNDHTGGLAAFLAENPDSRCTYPIPPREHQDAVQRAGARCGGDRPATLGARANTTASLDAHREQLSCSRRRRLVVITGCALLVSPHSCQGHPGGRRHPPGARRGFTPRRDAAAIAATNCQVRALGGSRLRQATARRSRKVRALAEAFGVFACRG